MNSDRSSVRSSVNAFISDATRTPASTAVSIDSQPIWLIWRLRFIDEGRCGRSSYGGEVSVLVIIPYYQLLLIIYMYTTSRPISSTRIPWTQIARANGKASHCSGLHATRRSLHHPA